MMQSEQIKQRLIEAMNCELVQVEGVGEYFEALIVSQDFSGKNRVQRQQLVNALFKSDFDSGALHALSMKTLTPTEWSALSGQA